MLKMRHHPVIDNQNSEQKCLRWGLQVQGSSVGWRSPISKQEVGSVWHKGENDEVKSNHCRAVLGTLKGEVACSGEVSQRESTSASRIVSIS